MRDIFYGVLILILISSFRTQLSEFAGQAQRYVQNPASFSGTEIIDSLDGTEQWQPQTPIPQP